MNVMRLQDPRDPSIFFLDHDYLESMYTMAKKIAAKERIVGFYSTGGWALTLLCAAGLVVARSSSSSFTRRHCARILQTTHCNPLSPPFTFHLPLCRPQDPRRRPRHRRPVPEVLGQPRARHRGRTGQRGGAAHAGVPDGACARACSTTMTMTKMIWPYDEIARELGS